MLDANQRTALAIIRSLGSRGVTIVTGDRVAHSIGAISRYASTSVVYPDPTTAPVAFVREIVAIVERLGIDTIIPATDLTTMLLVSQPALSKIARLAAPRAASYETLTDKARLLELAGRLRIPVPETRIASNATLVIEAAHDIGFPIVLKPSRSRYLKDGEVVSTAVEIVKGPNQLSAALARTRWLNDIPCLVQRFIPGHGAGVFALYASSGPVAWFAHRRIREKPPTGGVSVLCESVPTDPVMQGAAVKLLAAADWSGVAMVEFRVAGDGTAYLMEVNGRFWGSLQLAIDCGVDFPWLLYQLTQGRVASVPPSYTTGRRLRWLLGDLDSLIIAIRRGGLGRGDKLRAAGAFLRSFADPSCRQEMLRLSDPLPGALELVHWLTDFRRRPYR